MRPRPNNGYYALRWKILERDQFTCQYCGQYAPNVKLEIDHVIPVSKGGTDEPTNLKTSCYSCNRGRSGLKIILNRKESSLPRKPYPYISKERRPPIKDKIIALIGAQALTPKQIAKGMNITSAYARVIVSRMAREGFLQLIVEGNYHRYVVKNIMSKATSQHP